MVLILQFRRTLSRHPGLQRNLESTISWLVSRQSCWIFLLGSAVSLGLAIWLSCVGRLFPGDALSRTYDAVVILHSRFPRLSAIGLRWPPLPTLAQLPLATSVELAASGLAGGTVTALAGGALLATLNSLLRWAGLSGWSRLFLIAPFALNPVFLFYSANGMSEMPFLLFFTASTAYFLRWLTTERWQESMFAGFSTALMFGCRYDAVPYAAAFTLGMLGVLMYSRSSIQLERAEAHLLLYLAPTIYAVFLWLYFNWLIVGDPIFFLRSNYSNAYLTRNMALDPQVAAIRGSWPLAIWYLVATTGSLSPLYIILGPVAAVQAFRQRDMGLAGLLLLTLAPPVFQFVMYRGGQTFGFLRFYISVQPGAVLLAAYLLRQCHGWARRALLSLVAVSLAAGVWTSCIAMQQSSQDAAFIQLLRGPRTVTDNWENDRTAAAAIRLRFEERPVLVLADSQTENVVLFSMIPHRFILPSDPDFEQALSEPSKYADYVLIGVRSHDEVQNFAIQERYPDLYEFGGTGLVLDSEVGRFRLYRSVNR